MARPTRILTLIVSALIFNALHAQDTLFARQTICTLASPAMYGRGMQHRGDSIAADFLRKELSAYGLKPLAKNYFQYFRFPRTTTRPPIVQAGYRSQNVCAYLPGESDSMIVFTAHYEHLGTHGDTIFYGAHDNASGTAAVLDLARALSTQKRHYTYVFLFFGGEEAGLVGSSYFADVPLIGLDKVKLLVNLDLFCGGDEGLMVVNAHDERTSPYVDLLEGINEEHRFAAKIARRANAANSDHYHFTPLCPAVFIYTLGGRYGGYHNPQDTCEACGLENYSGFVSLLLELLRRLENS